MQLGTWPIHNFGVTGKKKNWTCHRHHSLLFIYRDFPGLRTVFSVENVLCRFRIPGFSPGQASPFEYKYQDFANAGHDVVAFVSSVR